jgi:hypothetical protein
VTSTGTVIPFAQRWEPAARQRRAAELVGLLSPASLHRISGLAAEPRTLPAIGQTTDEELEEAFALDWLAALGIVICHERTRGRSAYRLSALGWAIYNHLCLLRIEQLEMEQREHQLRDSPALAQALEQAGEQG